MGKSGVETFCALSGGSSVQLGQEKTKKTTSGSQIILFRNCHRRRRKTFSSARIEPISEKLGVKKISWTLKWGQKCSLQFC